MKKFNKLGLIESKGRIFKEKKSLFRGPFHRDRDRIIHSASFRRLKHKTQVFVNTEGDHYRTRMTHSLEVSQIARSISKYLNLNEDLTETLSLSHDLGHTPFGHAGEEALNDCMSKFGGFDHNLQTLRIVMFLEKKYLKFNGLNLSVETLDGLLKHNGNKLDLIKIDNIVGLENLEKVNLYLNPSLEAQVASLSDDIAYNNHDILDGLLAGLFKFDELLELNFFNSIYKKYKKTKSYEKVVVHQVIRDSIDLMVRDIIQNTKNNIKKNKISNINQIYLKEKFLVSFTNKVNDILNDIRFFLRKKMYNNKKVLKKNNEGKKIVKNLFIHISRNPKRFINQSKLDFDKNRLISDFIAGMTDRYAMNLNNLIK